MKELKNNISKIFVLFSLVVFIIASCDIGLGSSVDTETPVLSITSPESASIIRGSFAINGEWSDDGEIAGVTCILTNVDKKTSQYKLNAEVVKEKTGVGTWSAVIESGSVPDGTYEASVTIEDKAGHSTNSVRQLVIDNTAPVVILKRPSSAKGESQDEIDGYGQVFTLKGLAADDNGVGLIEVNIYKDEALTQLVKTVSKKNVPKTISLDIAQFVEGEENAYSEIYGSTNRNEGAQTRYCQIIAYDGAQAYPQDGSEQTEEDLKGNASTTYYLYENISSSVLSDYKIDELYAMKNGSYTAGTNARSVLSTLDENEVEVGIFTLNPANNPTYSVSGYSESMSVNNGGMLVVNVKPGLDSYLIEEKSLSLALQQYDSNGNLSSTKITPGNITIEKSGTVYTISVKISKDDGLTIGKSYLLTVEGYDEKGNSLVPEADEYKFRLNSKGEKPKLKIKNPESSATVELNDSNENITVKGTVYFSSDTCDGGSIIIKNADGSLSWNAGTFMDVKDSSGNLITQYTDSIQEWEITLNLKKNSSAQKDSNGNLYLPDGNHTLTVYAFTGTDFSDSEFITSSDINLKIDTQIPSTPTLSSINGIAYSQDKWYTGKNVKVVLNASDAARSGYASGLLASEYKFEGSENWVILEAASSGYINGIQEGKNTLSFKSEDAVGNSSNVSTLYTIYIDNVKPDVKEVFLGDDSEWHTLKSGSVNNIDLNYKTELKFEVEEANVLSDINVSLNGTALAGSFTQNEDLTKWLWKSNGSAVFTENEENPLVITAKDAAGNTVSVTYKVLLDTKGPDIEITLPVRDLKGEESLNNQNAASLNLRAGISDAAGKVKEKGTKYLLTKNPFENEAAIKDSAENDASDSESSLWNVSPSAGSVSVPVVAEEGKWYLYIYSIDEAGNSNTATRWFWYDNAKPDLSFSQKPDKTIYNADTLSAGAGTITFAGTASDTNGIEKVEFSKDGGTTWETLATGENGEWQKTVNYGSSAAGSDVLADGEYTFIIKATDKAERSSSESFSVTIDTKPPVVDSIVIKEEPNVNGWYNSLDLNVEVSASDATSGISLVQYSTDKTSWTPLSKDSASGKYTGPVSFASNGENTLYIKVSDIAGNNTEDDDNTKQINIDAQAPDLSAKYIQAGSGNIAEFAGNAYVNSSITIWGQYSDSVSGVNPLSLNIGGSTVTKGLSVTYSTEDLPASAEEVLEDDGFADYSAINDKKTIKSWKAVLTSEGFSSGSLKVSGNDFAGNAVSAQQSTTIHFDTIAPEIEDTISITDNSENTSAYNTGNDSTGYFVNNSEGKTFTIKGISTDETGLASTELKIGGKSYSNSGNVGSWNFNIDDLNSYSESVTAVITAIDLAGNSVSRNIKINFDVSGPSSSMTAVSGSAYSAGMWGTSSTLSVSGTITDSGSGTSRIYYKKYTSSPTDEQKNEFAASYKTSNNGIIYAESSPYSGSVTGLSEEKNYLLFVAEDKVGNPTLDTAVYEVQIDTQSPALASTSSGTKFSNGNSDVIVTGTCSDSGSGIKEVTVSVTIGSSKKISSASVDSQNGTWTATISADDLSGIEDGKTYNIDATAKDTAGNSTALTVAILQGDNNAPESELSAIKPAVANGSAYYVRPQDGLEIKGTTEDDYSTTVYTWLKLVPTDENGTETSNESDIVTTDEVTGTSWTITIPAGKLASSYKGADLYICTKDLAGTKKEGNKTTLTFDTAAPVFQRATSGDSVTKVGDSLYWDSDLETVLDVWQNKTMLSVQGAWKDSCGISNVYYKVTTSETHPAFADCTSTYSVNSKGNGLYTFNATISGFENGTNYIYMYAEDSLGTVSATPAVLTVKVDTVSPIGSEYTDTGVEPNKTYSFSDIYLTNSSSDIILYFYASDATSGISETSPLVTLGGNPLSNTESGAVYNKDTGLVTVTIKASELEGKNDYYPIVVTISDKAGNSTPVTIGTANIDTESPEVELDSPADADSSKDGIQVNGIITLKGTISDTYLDDSPFDGLVYSTDISTDISTWPSVTITADVSNSSSKDFSAKVDTTKFTDKTTYYFRAKAIDKAGNTGYSPVLELKVNQDSDRPVVSFTDISLPASNENEATKVDLNLNSKTLRGNISDDDGISKLEVSIVKENESDSFTEISVINGAWSILVSDGTYNVKFKVTDSKGTVFTSPKYTDETNTITKDINLSLMIDNAAPTTSDMKYSYSEGNWLDSIPTVGGARNNFALKLKAFDANGIASVTATLGEEHKGSLNADGEWVISGIDVSELQSATHTLTLVVTDGAGNSKKDTLALPVDNTAPELSITSPKASDTSSGSVLVYGSITGAKQKGLYYALSPSGSQKPDGTAVSSWQSDTGADKECSGATLVPAYSEGIDFGINWSINFDGNTESSTGVHAKLMNDYLIEYGITTKNALEATDNTQFETVVKLYLWVKAEDEVGNVTESSFPILLDPQGDRPSVQIKSPDSNGVVLGKKVSIYGTHSDTKGTINANIGVKSVWVQIISEANDNIKTDLKNRLEWSESNEISTFTISKDDLDYMAENGYSVYNMKTYDPDGTNTSWTANSSSIEDGYSASDYAALANISGATWNLTINANNELNPNASSDGKNPVGIRVYAKDGDGKLSAAAQRLVFFDSDTPQIENLHLVQYESDGETIKSSRAYSQDMYITGNWYLTGTATDDETVTSLVIKNKDNNTEVLTTTGTSNSLSFDCPLNASGTVGTFSYSITVKDNANHSYTEDVVIHYDNKAPELAGSENTNYNISKIIKQSNGYYKFGSLAKEDAVDSTAQSGFAYTAFYFMRSYQGNSGEVTKLYDILQSNSLVSENPSSLLFEDGLYWYEKSVSHATSDTLNVLTLDNTEGIHINSLIKTGGAYYLVTDISGSKVTIDGYLSADAKFTTAYVAVAGVIDNTIPEINRDDGDGMTESVTKTGTSWIWEASVNSKNISDGPVTLVYVVFDKAGNCIKQEVNGIISNNPPRLAGFSIYTDYNADGNVDSDQDGKYTEYISSTYGKDSVTGTSGGKSIYDPDAESVNLSKNNPLKNSITAGSSDGPVMTLRGKTVIKAEIVGGNGNVYYDYSFAEKSGSNNTALFEGTTDYTAQDAEINIQLGDLIGLDTDSAPFKFTFRDSVEGRSSVTDEDFINQMSSYLTVYMGIAANSANEPTVKINPFYWNGINDNSVYDSNGHIELEADWKKSSGYDSSTSGEYDADPKVSGQIVVTGSAHDDNLIGSLKASLFGTEIELAEFNHTSGSLEVLEAVKSVNYADNGYWFEIKEGSENFNEKGHDVEWTLYINTEKVGVAALDAELTVTATNIGIPSCSTDGGNLVSIDGSTKYTAGTYSGGSSNTPGTTQTGTAEGDEPRTAYYRMDIVPYITGVTTSLSYANSDNPSVYNRTALGHYPVYMTFEGGTDANKTKKNYSNAIYETVTVTGYNLAAGATVTFEKGTESNTATLSASDSGYTFKVPNGAKSGDVTFAVNGVSSLNNKNNNDSNGSSGKTTSSITGDADIYQYYYNRLPNGENNNILTDDLVLDVWDLNRRAAVPKDNSAKDIMMKINPSSRMLGFAFCDGSLRWSMANGVDTSYSSWAKTQDFIQCTGFTIDPNGLSYGTCAGGESDSSYADTFNFYVSKWGSDTGNNTYDDASTGLKIGSTVVDDWANLTKNRFQSPSIASNGTYAFLSYFDLFTGEIRFQGGKTIPDSKDSIGTLKDSFTGGKYSVLKTLDQEHSLLQVVASNDGVPDPIDSSKEAYSGDYVSIGLTSDNYVVMVWYDAIHNNLMYSYIQAPDSTETGVNRTNWSAPETLLSGAGKYCQLAVDSENHIHIACFDSQNGDLKYVYLSDKTASSIKTCTVDSYQTVGKELTIDVAKVGDYQIPHIGYYGTTPKKPRYAYLADPEKFYGGTALNGVENDLYTGVWECSIVPTIKVSGGTADSNGNAAITADEKRRINVGVWKSSDGSLAYSTGDGTVTGANKYTQSYAKGGEGKCYGNGSNNAVLAYGVKYSNTSDYVETAQMR